MSSSSYYKLIVFSILAVLLASCGSKKSAVSHQTKAVQHDVVEYGKKYLNTPYRYAGTGPSSFDCSGFTSFVFRKFGYNLNPSSAGQARQGDAINSTSELEVGDLVFFEGNSRNGRVGHVGIVSDIRKGGRFKFIHASTSNGVIISSSEEPYYKTRYLRGGRVIKDTPKKKQEPTTEETVIAESNHIKIQEHVVYKETDDGFVAVNSVTGKPLKDEQTVSTEQPAKPVRKTEQEDDKEKKKKKKKSEIRQTAIRGTEETLVTPPSKAIHKVKPGETLYSIAKKHNCSVEQLKRWNPDIENNVIQAGDELDIYQ
jgi:LysM repeat protein